MIFLKEELSLEDKICFGSSGVEQSPEKACVGGANPSSATTPRWPLITYLFVNKIKLERFIKKN